MIQDDFKYNSKLRASGCGNCFLGILASIFMTFCSTWNYAQDAAFVSFNADTDIRNAIASSPDGKNVYAAGIYTMAVFERQANGTLKTLQVLNNDHQGIRGIHHIIDLVIAPDGRYLYALNSNDQSLLLFARDTSSGVITLVEVIRDSVFGSRLLLSPDGRHLYCGNNVLAVYERELNSGRLKKIQVLKNGDSELGGFNVPGWVAISPDGKNIYGGGKNGITMLVLSRNLETGRVAFQSSYDIDPTPWIRWEYGDAAVSADGKMIYMTNRFADKLFVFYRSELGELQLRQTLTHIQPTNVVVSLDSSHVYVEHFDNGGDFAIYSKDPNTGNLVLIDNFQTKLGAESPAGLCMSPLGDAIYMTSSTGTTVLQRNKTTGILNLLQYLSPNNIGGTDRLYASHAVEVSPDGNFLYVAAHSQDAGISVFSRHRDDGQLTQVASYPLTEVYSMTMTPDGRHIYVTMGGNSPIHIFERDQQNGFLQQFSPPKDSLGPGWSLPFMFFTPEGSYLYVTNGSRIKVFAREPTSGTLTFIQEFIGHPYSLTHMPRLTVSPDGNHLYWSGVNDHDVHQIATFSKDVDSGKLSFLRIQTFNPTYTTGPLAIKVSPDGRHVYAAVQDLDCDQPPEAAMVILGRDTTTGMLSFIDTIIFPFGSETRDLIISPDGRDVYALGGYGGSGLAMLERNASTGKVTWRARFGSSTGGVYGLNEARALALSPDGQFIYTAGDLGVVTFTTGRGNTNAVREETFATVPRILTLEQNYPNPFSALFTNATIGNASTTMRYEIPATTNGAVPVELSLYNMQGQLVRTLVNERKSPGQYSTTWNGLNAYGELVPSGIYFYRIKAGESVATRRLVIVR